ncbi:13828_t:CDS:2 [Racocetra fulgida]|uniref:13828_t:CDS:1 n=1 Tax=Racocetra fulgida TaxID=60492 RepID=A0A9N9CHM2_9GLOM|nr:13828_t:CDS:2 [Racocetra fulgida]
MSIMSSQDIFNDYDYVPDNCDIEDLKSVVLAESLTSGSVVESIIGDGEVLNNDIEIPFLFNNTSFERARELLEEDENDDIFLLKNLGDNDNIDIDDKAMSSIFDSELSFYGNEHFIENATTSQTLSVSVQSRKEVLWKLVDELFAAFLLTNPKTQEIFASAQEMTPVGFSKLFLCYDRGISRLIAIQRQDVYKIDPPNQRRCRKHNVVVYRLADLSSDNQSRRRNQQTNNLLQRDCAEDNNVMQQQAENANVKRQCRYTTNDEKILLEDLLMHDSFPEDLAIEVLRNLQDLSNDWDMQRIRIYWNNNRLNKRKNPVNST